MKPSQSKTLPARTEKGSALEKMKALVAKFARELPEYKDKNYSEARVRQHYIDPFWEILGWDMRSDEVVPEENPDDSRQERADYAFWIPAPIRVRKFFVEAKKPAVRVEANPDMAYQVRKYGWNGSLPVCVATDFEEFAVYDCTKEPHPNDLAKAFCKKYLGYTEYATEAGFSFLWDTFGKASVVAGSLEDFAQKHTDIRIAISVDKAFLASLEDWRKYLATSIALKNRQLEAQEVSIAV